MMNIKKIITVLVSSLLWLNAPCTAFAEENVQSSGSEDDSTEEGSDVSDIVLEEDTGTDVSETTEGNDSDRIDSESNLSSGADDISNESSEDDGEQSAEADTTGLVLQEGDILKAPSAKSGPRRTPAATTASVDYDGAAQTAIAAIRNRQTEVDISSYGIPISNISQLSTRIYNTSGDLFYFSKYSYYYSSSNIVTKLSFTYNSSYTDAQIQAFYDKVDEVVGSMDSSWSDIEKILYLHDYMVTNIDYDFTYSKYNSYNALIEKSSVCQGYSLLFDYFMERIGIPCEVISSSDLNHAWNEINLGNQNYYVDCTWDDPTGCIEEYCRHMNFLVDQDKLYNDDKHSSTDWVNSKGDTVYGGTSSDKYNNYFWQSTNTLIPQTGRKCAYIRSADSKYYISQYDFATSSSTDLYTLPSRWPVFGKAGYSWNYTYSQLRKMGQGYLFTTPTDIYTLSQSGDSVLAYELSDDEKSKGNIIGITVADESAGTVNYNVYDSPNAASGENLIAPDASGTFTIQKATPLEITEQPKDVTVEDGKQTTITVFASGDGLSYQWQYKAKTGTEWKNTYYSGCNTNKLTVDANYKYTGDRYYKCLITDANGNSIESDAALVSVTGITIESQPSDISASDGSQATLTVKASGKELKYSWQFKPKAGSSWKNTYYSGYNTSKLTVDVKSSYTGDRYYRCLITDGDGNSVTSNAASVSISAITITSQPKNEDITDGSQASISVTASGTSLQYQWQYKAKNGTEWKNTYYSGFSTSKLTVDVNTKYTGDRYYRCIITDGNGNSITSDAALVSVRTITITSQSQNVSVDDGGQATLNVTARGNSLKYQWQYKAKNSTEWKNTYYSGFSTNKITVDVNTKYTGDRYYRCVITDSNKKTVYSNSALVSVK